MTMLAKTSVWTNNSPNQHYVNGAAKRAPTAHRCAMSLLKLAAGRTLSFVIECLTHAVKGAHFLAEPTIGMGGWCAFCSAYRRC